MDSLWAPIIAAITAVVVLAIERWIHHRATIRELRRRALEEWLGTLLEWVDEHRRVEPKEAAKALIHDYQRLSNRQLLELRFKRRDRYVAWWMHMMLLSLVDKGFHEDASAHFDVVTQEIGEVLLRWHHGELRSSDFAIPYALRNEASKSVRDVGEVATELNLTNFVDPKRTNWRGRLTILNLIADPESGKRLLPVVGPYVGWAALMQSFLLTLPRGARLGLGYTKQRVRLSWSEFRLARSEIRLTKMQRRLNKLKALQRRSKK